MYENENKESFFARLEPRLSPYDLVRVRGAYLLSKHGHRSQTRREEGPNGDPLRYFEHPRRVALRMMDTYRVFDADCLCTGLLHDAFEDTEDIDALIVQQFLGPEVARRVRLLSKDPKAGYFERLASSDPIVRFGKLVDREDNLESLPSDDDAFVLKTLKDTYVLLGVLRSYDNRYDYYGSRAEDPDQRAFGRVMGILRKYAQKGVCGKEWGVLREFKEGSLQEDYEENVRLRFGF